MPAWPTLCRGRHLFHTSTACIGGCKPLRYGTVSIEQLGRQAISSSNVLRLITISWRQIWRMSLVLRSPNPALIRPFHFFGIGGGV